MKKGTLLTFVLSVIVFTAIGIVVVMLVTPQSDPGVFTKTEYEQISKNEYVYVPTKEITAEGIEKNYEVDREYLNNLETKQGYKPRKDNNPFSTGNTSGDNTNSNTNNSNNNNNTTNQPTTGNSSTDAPDNNPSSPNSNNNGATGTAK